MHRNLDKHYNNLYAKTKKKLERYPFRDAEYYYQLYRMADIANMYFDNQKIRKYDEALQLASDNLDLFFLSSKLKYSCEMLDRRRILSSDYHTRMLGEILSYIEGKPYEQIPSIYIYYLILLTLTKENVDEPFDRLKGMLDRHALHFNIEELKRIYLHAINFCIQRIRMGERKYIGECLNLYIQGIEQKVMLENGYISPWTFKNIIKLALQIKGFDWTENFILNNQTNLATEFRNDVLHYNLADLYLHKQDYSSAQQSLIRVGYSDIHMLLDSKIMLLRIYYETDEEEALLALIASFNILLKRNKHISNNVRLTYQNFLQILHGLVKKDKKLIPELRTKMNDTQLLTSRSWLMQKINELEKGST